MNNHQWREYRFLFLLIAVMAGGVLRGQTLYQDALEIITTTRDNATHLEIQSEAGVQVLITKAATDRALLPVIRTFDQPSPVVIALENNTNYDLSGLSGQPLNFRLWQGQDTFPKEGYLTSGDFETVIEHYAGYAKILTDDTQTWVKKQFLDLHSTLAFYEQKKRGATGRYNIDHVYQKFKDNPYLGPVVKSEAFSPGPADDRTLDQLIKGIEEGIAERKAHRLPTGLDLLRRDSVISTENLLSIINIQKEYQVPPIKNPEALSGKAENVKAAQLSTGAADFTSTLVAGLSDFVVARAQDEFNVSFMNRFQAKLKEVPELQKLFPQSEAFLKDIDITNYKSVLVSAREAFQTDVKNLGLNFTGLFELDKYKALQNDPVVYNLLTVYQMMELVYRGIPLDTILPLTFNQLVRRQEELGKEINLELAAVLQEKANTELQTLADDMQVLEDSLQSVWLDLSRMEQRFLFDIARRLGRLQVAQKQQVAEVFLKMDEKLAPIRMELSNSLDTLQIIPSNLRGTLNYDYLFDQARLGDFNRFFERPPDPVGLIGAGLELTRQQVKGIDGKPSKAELLMAYLLTLKEASEEYQNLVHELERDSLQELVVENERLANRRIALIGAIAEDLRFWEERKTPDHEIKGLEFIARSIAAPREFQSFYDEGRQPATLADTLQARRRLLARAETILKTQLDTLNRRYPGDERSQLEAFFDPEEAPALPLSTTPIDRLQVRAFDLISQSGAVAQTLDGWDDQYCSHLIKARTNTQIFGSILELSSYLVNTFRIEGEEGEKWISPMEFNALIGDNYRRNVFLGLVYQNLSEVSIFKDFSNEGVANLVSGFINTLGEVHVQTDTLRAFRQGNQRPRLRDYFPLIEATVTMVNEVLETPLVVRRDLNGEQINAPLTAVYPAALQNIPDVSREILGLFENVSYENYRYAIDNAVNLFDLLSQRSLAACLDATRPLTNEERKSCKNRVKAIQNIVKYGNFISDIAMAQQPEDIKQALLNVDVAGKSSQTKREDQMNLSLNGYFGGAFAQEYPNANGVNSFTVGSLSVPIGLTFSFKLGKKDPGSMSLFLPVIDIGAVTSFRIEGGGDRYPELNLSNFIAPGIFLYRNMKNSPFYYGLGYQYGPNIREININGNLEKVNASRFMFFNFGIDVPFFSLARVRN